MLRGKMTARHRTNDTTRPEQVLDWLRGLRRHDPADLGGWRTESQIIEWFIANCPSTRFADHCRDIIAKLVAGRRLEDELVPVSGARNVTHRYRAVLSSEVAGPLRITIPPHPNRRKP